MSTRLSILNLFPGFLVMAWDAAILMVTHFVFATTCYVSDVIDLAGSTSATLPADTARLANYLILVSLGNRGVVLSVSPLFCVVTGARAGLPLRAARLRTPTGSRPGRFPAHRHLRLLVG